MADYKFDLAVLFQDEHPALQSLLDAVHGFCDEVIRSQVKPDDIDYTASQILAVLEKLKTWQPVEDNWIHDGLVVLELYDDKMHALIANEDCFLFRFQPGVRVCRLEESA